MSTDEDNREIDRICPVCKQVQHNVSLRGLTQHISRYCTSLTKRSNTSLTLSCGPNTQPLKLPARTRTSAAPQESYQLIRQKRARRSRNELPQSSAVQYNESVLYSKPSLLLKTRKVVASEKADHQDRVQDILLDHYGLRCEDDFAELPSLGEVSPIDTLNASINNSQRKLDRDLPMDEANATSKPYAAKNVNEPQGSDEDSVPDFHHDGHLIDSDAESIHSEDEEDDTLRLSDNWSDYQCTRDECLASAISANESHWLNYCKNIITDIPPREQVLRSTTTAPKLTPMLIAQSSLLHLMNSNRRVTKSLFDKVMEWALHFGLNYPQLWLETKQELGQVPFTSRSYSLNCLKRAFDWERFEPKPKVVTLFDNRRLTVPVTSVEESIYKLLSDPNIMRPENLIQTKYFCRVTWKNKVMLSDYKDDDIISELSDGTMFQNGQKRYGNHENKPPGVDRVLPCPLVIYTDESHHNKAGTNKSSPCTITLGVFNAKARAQQNNYVNVAFFPNPHIGKGKNANNYDHPWHVRGKKRGDKHLNADRVRRLKVEDQHKIYDCFLEEIRDICHKKGGIVFDRVNEHTGQGERCLAKIYVLLLSLDQKEAFYLTNHYSCSGSKNVRALCHICSCSFDKIGHVPTRDCDLIHAGDIARSLMDEKYAKLISQHNVESKWNTIPLPDPRFGIHGITPQERLHVFGMGTYNDVPRAVLEMIGPEGTKKAEKEALDLLCQGIAMDLTRNSERSRPDLPSALSSVDMSRLTAGQRQGSCLSSAIAIFSVRGRSILKEFVPTRSSPDKIVNTMCMVLAYDLWLQGPHLRKAELSGCRDAVRSLMHDMKEYLPLHITERVGSIPGSNGYHKVKFHALWHMPLYVSRFGPSSIWTTEHGEKFHQSSVGANGDLTQQRSGSFNHQVSQNDYERNVVNHAYNVFGQSFPKYRTSDEGRYDLTSAERHLQFDGEINALSRIETLGKFSLVCTPAVGQMLSYNATHKWEDPKKNILKIGVSQELIMGIQSIANVTDYKQPFTCHCYTELRHHHSGGSTIYRASESFYDSPWYDWALVDNSDDDQPPFIALIHGFVQFPAYFPSPRENESEHNVDSLYMAVSASEETFTEQALFSNMLTKFGLTRDGGVYVLPVTSIICPLLVVRDFGASSIRRHICVAPMRKWGEIFSNYIVEKQSRNDEDEYDT